MIKEVSGDIMLTKAQAIAHGIAPHDHFDSGLALNLRQDYPSMVRDFRHWCHQTNPKPGGAWLWGSSNGIRIVNLMTQEPAQSHGHGHPGNATLQYVTHALRDLKKILEDEKIESLALPRLATGVGGLKWEEVKPIVYNALEDSKVKVYLYTTFVKGQAAQE